MEKLEKWAADEAVDIIWYEIVPWRSVFHFGLAPSQSHTWAFIEEIEWYWCEPVITYFIHYLLLVLIAFGTDWLLSNRYGWSRLSQIVVMLVEARQGQSDGAGGMFQNSLGAPWAHYKRCRENTKTNPTVMKTEPEHALL